MEWHDITPDWTGWNEHDRMMFRLSCSCGWTLPHVAGEDEARAAAVEHRARFSPFRARSVAMGLSGGSTYTYD